MGGMTSFFLQYIHSSLMQLQVASQSLQLDVAKLLLQEGADPHTSSWDKGK
jgi:hypothetical protein